MAGQEVLGRNALMYICRKQGLATDLGMKEVVTLISILHQEVNNTLPALCLIKINDRQKLRPKSANSTPLIGEYVVFYR